VRAVVIIDHFRLAQETVTYAEGDTIFAVGDPGSVMYGIKSGEVELYFNGKLLETVGPGGILGVKTLIDANPHTTTAIARTECQLVPVDQDRFLFLVHETPTFALQVMRIMAERTRAIMRLAVT
jgi:CRP/FNR family transcriptional regulator, cyclic AMP receptor protein